MPYGRFAAYNVGGAILWSVLFVGAGALLGNLPAVKHNFSIVGPSSLKSSPIILPALINKDAITQCQCQWNQLRKMSFKFVLPHASRIALESQPVFKFGVANADWLWGCAGCVCDHRSLTAPSPL